VLRVSRAGNRRRAYGAVLAVSAVMLAGCAEPGVEAAASERCGVVPLVDPGERTTIVRAPGDPQKFSVLATAALPEGDIVLAVQNNVPMAGEDGVSDFEPELLILDTEGVCTPFPLPVAEGVAVTQNALPVAVGQDGTLYLWDVNAERIVSGRADEAWVVEVDVPEELTFGVVDADVAPDGTLYVATGAAAFRVISGRLEMVAGTGEELADGQSFPVPDLGPFPRPATSQPLPLLRGMATSPDGDLLLVSQSAVFAVDPGGTMRMIADPVTTRGQRAAIVARHEANSAVEGSILTGIAVTETGDLLVGDTAGRRVIRIRDGQTSLLAGGVASMPLGDPLDTLRDQLFIRTYGDGALAVLGVGE
jgi:hypothetical protein